MLFSPQRCRCFISVLASASMIAGCSTSLTPEALPYRFRQSLVELKLESLSQSTDRRGSHARPASGVEERWRQATAARCRKLIGHTFAGPHEPSVDAMLRACLGQGLPAGAIAGRHLHLRTVEPQLGDLVLFHNTRDRNGNGRVDDLFTDAGVVVGLTRQQVEFIYLRHERVRSGVLSLAQPHNRRRGPSRVQNTYLRVKQLADPPEVPYLAGELLAGFASLDPVHGARM